MWSERCWNKLKKSQVAFQIHARIEIKNDTISFSCIFVKEYINKHHTYVYFNKSDYGYSDEKNEQSSWLWMVGSILSPTHPNYRFELRKEAFNLYFLRKPQKQ